MEKYRHIQHTLGVLVCFCQTYKQVSANVMTTRHLRQIVILFSFCGFLSCTSDDKKYNLAYPKYYDKYSFQQLTDTLFSDTLMVGLDVDGASNQRKWYADKISELLSDLKSDWKNPDSLFPLTSFDKIKISKSPWEFEQTLNNDQANRLLKIITDPTAFNWSETTSELEYVFEFYKDDKQVSSLELGADRSVFNPRPNWPSFKKMKFGHLKNSARQQINNLIDEITK